MYSLTTDHPVLYKRGAKGEIRTWRMQSALNTSDDAGHRVLSGILDGVETPSGWAKCEAKNVGKSNSTTAADQAYNECGNLYEIKMDRGYFMDITCVDNWGKTKPMLAASWDKRSDKIDWAAGVISQPKLDGIRCIARADGLWTRTGKAITSIPHIAQALAPLFEANPDLILDGELYNHDLRDDFNTITSIVRKAKPSEAELERAAEVIQYHVYDLPAHGGTAREREAELAGLWMDLDGNESETKIHFVDTAFVADQETLDQLYGAYIEQGYEGQMIRLPEGLYEFKRSNGLIKRKEFLTDEFKVYAVHEGNGNWRGCAKRFYLLKADGTLFGAGVRGNQKTLARLLADVGAGRSPTWVTCRYFTPTPDGIPRFAVVIDYGTGKRED
jgi:DNA ligase-1